MSGVDYDDEAQVPSYLRSGMLHVRELRLSVEHFEAFAATLATDPTNSSVISLMAQEASRLRTTCLEIRRLRPTVSLGQLHQALLEAVNGYETVASLVDEALSLLRAGDFPASAEKFSEVSRNLSEVSSYMIDLGQTLLEWAERYAPE